ncbi:MAG: transporter substrate-binding domain-containing protein [Clostridia bacterium]
MKSFKATCLMATLALTLTLSGCGLPNYTLVAEDYVPYVYLDSNNKLTGFSTELVQAAMKEENITKDIIVTPWTTIYNKLQNTPNYIAFSVGRNAERENKFIWIAQVGTYTGSIYGLKNNKAVIKNLNDLKKYKIGTVKDHYTQNYLLKNGFKEGKNLFSIDADASSDATNVQKLIDKKIDFLIANRRGIDYIVKNNSNFSEKIKLFYTIKELELPAYLAASKGTSQEIIDKFTEGFNKIKANGIYDEIINK